MVLGQNGMEKMVYGQNGIRTKWDGQNYTDKMEGLKQYR